MKPIIIISILIIIVLGFFFVLNSSYLEAFDNNTNTDTKPVEIVISRYNETLDWINQAPFSQYPYIVYNKGPNAEFTKTDKFQAEIPLENVGREAHSYLSHITKNYDDQTFAVMTIFVPGSLDSDVKLERAKRLFQALPDLHTTDTDIFACIMGDNTFQAFREFQLDNYLSTHPQNNSINKDASIKPSDIRPYGSWYQSFFGETNTDSKCFPQNAMFGISKKSILSKPKSYYENLIKQVDNHHNPETGHYFERAWETVFHHPERNVLHVV
jgi:Protein of unknown function (DUF3431)